MSDWKTEKKQMLMEFDELLNSIDSAGSKEKILWRQIYNNAISDRQNANLCFLDVHQHLRGDVDNHMQLGRQATDYLTRMEKSNEQLLKLSALIQKSIEAQHVEEELDEDRLLQEIQESQMKR